MSKSYDVCEELCRRCTFRAQEGAFVIYHCDYALATEKCRLDVPGTCTHFVEDERYDERAEWAKREERRIKLQKQKEKYREAHKDEYRRPVGRPKKEREW